MNPRQVLALVAVVGAGFVAWRVLNRPEGQTVGEAIESTPAGVLDLLRARSPRVVPGTAPASPAFRYTPYGGTVETIADPAARGSGKRLIVMPAALKIALPGVPDADQARNTYDPMDHASAAYVLYVQAREGAAKRATGLSFTLLRGRFSMFTASDDDVRRAINFASNFSAQWATNPPAYSAAVEARYPQLRTAVDAALGYVVSVGARNRP